MLALLSKWPQVSCGTTKTNKFCLINFFVFLAFGLFINPQKGFSQAIAGYTFTASNGTYTTLTGGMGVTYLNGGNTDDNASNNNSFGPGFSFYLGGIAYTTFNVSTNGFITLGNAA